MTTDPKCIKCSKLAPWAVEDRVGWLVATRDETMLECPDCVKKGSTDPKPKDAELIPTPEPEVPPPCELWVSAFFRDGRWYGSTMRSEVDALDDIRDSKNKDLPVRLFRLRDQPDPPKPDPQPDRDVVEKVARALGSAWAALGDNLESRAHGGTGITKEYTHAVQKEIREAEAALKREEKPR